MRIFALPFLFLFAGCVYPSFSASRTIDLTIPAPGLTVLACTSHNGNITVNGDPAATQVEVHAELTVRGYSQGEADDNLRLMSVGQDFVSGKLTVFGNYPTGALNNMSPSFAFTLKVPQQVAIDLTSHNGDITAKGTVGDQRMISHNGDIDGIAKAGRLTAETHNGRVELDIQTDGPVEGAVESHNGDIGLRFGSTTSTTLSASTHNGDITTNEGLRDATIGKHSLRARIGDGTGALNVATHNGNVRIR